MDAYELVENWNLLNSREKNNKELVQCLFQIHTGAFDDLRIGGNFLTAGDTKISEIAAIVDAQQRFQIAVALGRAMIEVQGKPELFHKCFAIKAADLVPNCIFIALAAMIENLEGAINRLYPDKKMEVVCEYETISGLDDPLGKRLPLIEKCYPWVTLTTKTVIKEPKPGIPRYIPNEKTSLVFFVDRIRKIDTMRTCFSGTIQRGTIREGDVLNVIDNFGKVLCPEGVVRGIYTKGMRLEAALGMHIDELILTTEIPVGDYSSIFLVDGDKKLALSSQNNQEYGNGTAEPKPQAYAPQNNDKKETLWSKLFKK